MWSHVQKLLHNGHNGALPSVPLRKTAPVVADLAVGKRVRFSKQCPLKPLADARRELGDALGRGANQLLAGGHALFDDRPQIALDELRRA